MIYRSFLFLSVLLFIALGEGFSQKSRSIRATPLIINAQAAAPQVPAEAKVRHNAFLEVWSAIKDRYYDPTFNSLDWDKIRKEFEPKVIATKSDRELYGLLRQMIGRLGRSHLSIIPPEVYQAIEDTKSRAKERENSKALMREEVEEEPSRVRWLANDPAMPYGLGIDLALLDGKFVIMRVDKDSAAENAGLKAGHAIEAINGVSLDEMLNRMIIYTGSLQEAVLKNQMATEIVQSIINGEEDSHVEIRYSDGRGNAHDLRIRREPLRKDRRVSVAPNFPERTLSFESRTLDPSTGYIRFNLFATALVERFCAAVAEHSDKKALILDIRGNSGGLLGSLPVLLGMLSGKNVPVGTMRYRTGTNTLNAVPKARQFKGRIVVLVDGRTASAAEIFAVALRESGRAALVGERTAGEALPSVALRLSTGAMFVYPIANYVSGSGKQVEGTGVAPDEVIAWDRSSLLSGNDRQLEVAKRLANDATRLAALLSKPEQKIMLPPEYIGKLNQGGGPPPPPPPVKRGSGSGSGIAPPPPVQRALNSGHDEKAKRAIADFINAVGGRAALKAVSRYKLTGSVWAGGSAGSAYGLTVLREFPDKYAEIILSDTTGETRQLTADKKLYVQTSLGESVEAPMSIEANEADILGSILSMGDPEAAFPNLSFTGEYLREGRKTIVLEGRGQKGIVVALAFDVETKMLVGFSRGSFQTVSYGDYRSVGTIRLPFRIEHGGATTTVSEYDLTSVIDPAEFQKKQFCFDVAN